MRGKTMTAVVAVAVLVVAVATNAAWAGSRHGRGKRITRPPSVPASASARASASASASARTSSATSVPVPVSPATPSGSASTPADVGKVFFDDFSYSGAGDAALASNGWRVRSESGGPGIPGARWSRDAVTFVSDPDSPGNTVMRLRASTGGAAASTVQAEIGTRANAFLAGTYAARIFFTDAPTSGPDGDAVNQTFFTITPLRFDDDPIYSELDFEYLPNGGWGASRETMYLTSWYTYHNNPTWGGDRASGEAGGSLRGWHDLVMQVGSGTVTYFIDGVKVFASSGRYYPRQAMSIAFNQWFVEGGLRAGSTARAYDEQVDWVFHAADRIVSPAAVAEQIKAYRGSGVAFRDTVAR